jgi:hypothetical protein
MSRFSVSVTFVALSVLALGASAPAVAGTVVPCDGSCTWSLSIDGRQRASGQYTYDAESGVITPTASGRFGNGQGGWAEMSLNGNADPILAFGVTAGTGAAGSTFSFTFNLPIALSGPIDALSSVSYSLTSSTAAGAQIAPFLPSGKIVNAFEVDTSIGGLPSLNKGVDVGTAFFFTVGPATQNSAVQTASNALTGSLAYDLMSVTVAFSLSANSSVGLSGFVQQVPSQVPLPAGIWLLASALAGAGGMVRRRTQRLAAA